MAHIEELRCTHCGQFLLNKISDLPFEVVSTGAVIHKLSIDVNCGHCHKQGVYSMAPEFKIT